MATKKVKDKVKVEEALNGVKRLIQDKTLSLSELEHYSEIDYPLFSFKYLSDCSFDKCSDSSFFPNFLLRLKKLSELGWKRIAISDRHSFGFEKIPVSSIIPKDSLPKDLTSEDHLLAFRASGNNLPFLGRREGRTFYIYLIETKFGEIYRHD